MNGRGACPVGGYHGNYHHGGVEVAAAALPRMRDGRRSAILRCRFHCDRLRCGGDYAW